MVTSVIITPPAPVYHDAGEDATKGGDAVTLDDIRRMDRAVITPAIAAQVLGCDPAYIRVAARDAPEQLGFPVVRIGSRTKIPREAFVRYMEGGRT